MSTHSSSYRKGILSRDMENGFGGSHMDGNAITSDSELSSHDGTALIPHGTGAYHRPTSVRMSRRYSDSPPPTFPQQGKQSHSPRSTEGLSGIWANIGQICKIRALSGDQWRAVPFVFLITVAVLVVIIIKWKASLLPLLDQSVVDKRMVIYAMPDTFATRAQGMFAEFLAVVGALSYGTTHQAAAVAVNFQSEFYVDPSVGPNWWAYFFAPDMVLNPRIINPQETHYTRWVSRFGRFGSFSQVVTKTPNRPEGPFARFPFPVVGALSMHDVRTLVHKHIKIRSEISDEVSALRRTLGLSSPSSPLPQTSTASTAAIATHHPAFVSPPLATSTDPSALFVIGVHYRGLDKIDAYPFKQAPPDLFRAVIQEVVKTYQPSSWKLFVATDTADFLDFMLMVFGPDKVIYQKDVPRIYIKDVTYQADGTPVPVHKEKSFPPYIKAKTAITDMLLLSTCSYIVKNRSSLSDTSLFFSNNIHYSFILGPEDPVYHSDPRLPIRLPFSDNDFDILHSNTTGGPILPTEKPRLKKAAPKSWYDTFFY